MSHKLDPNDVPWPELPQAGEFFNSVWSPEAISASAKKFERRVVLLCIGAIAGIASGIAAIIIRGI